ncbi:unnamed protein product [Prunus armeniaca]|uniref:Uncharacterized protein n=1 Tax=Prunus armeniaca TaxID=36596 RepID=A0A6J5U709_PRUAR|nr:unnamed protein product [Prunus armeniaca]CAB4286189.1 unnamed protein product [Prunus armeniaca]CAB4302811.1 unnamed protein product [Prunus armeniaca]
MLLRTPHIPTAKKGIASGNQQIYSPGGLGWNAVLGRSITPGGGVPREAFRDIGRTPGGRTTVGGVREADRKIVEFRRIGHDK